ncbi:MAG: hypothetical protein Q8N42_02360 [bacterium]|nr:hypothetical protein [bacterium]
MRTLGIEREWFITENGKIVPRIGEFLPKIWEQAQNNGFVKTQFGFELFAGQVEDRTKVSLSIGELIVSLSENEQLLRTVGRSMGLGIFCKDYVTEEELGELVVNPFDERHHKIWAEIPKERKVAASQVAATHIHVSASLEEAVKALNACRKDLIDELVGLGDFSAGKRIQAYRVMAKTYGEPPLFRGAEELMAYISEHGGERNVWDLVRYKPSTGTVEFRMFGATENQDKIIEFVRACQSVVERA